MRALRPTVSASLVTLALAGACEGTSADADASMSGSASASAGSGDTGGGSTDGSTDTGGECAPLLDHDAWTVVEADADPFADHRPDAVECGLAGWYVEDGAKLEIDTNFCNYLGLTQPLLAPIELGQTLELHFYHFDLLAPEPALAHVAITIDAQVVWEQEIEIPAGSDGAPAHVFDESFPSPVSAEAGAPLVIHLHNHGQNTWTLQGLSAC